MNFQVTVRYGGRYQRYHTFHVEAEHAGAALEAASRAIPAEIAPQADLVELRIAADPEKRTFVEGV